MADKEEQQPADPEMVENVVFIEPGTRIITANDWEQAGVKGRDDVVWGQHNNWTVPRDKLDLDDDQFNRIIAMDPGFRVERVPAPEE